LPSMGPPSSNARPAPPVMTAPVPAVTDDNSASNDKQKKEKPAKQRRRVKRAVPSAKDSGTDTEDMQTTISITAPIAADGAVSGLNALTSIDDPIYDPEAGMGLAAPSRLQHSVSLPKSLPSSLASKPLVVYDLSPSPSLDLEQKSASARMSPSTHAAPATVAPQQPPYQEWDSNWYRSPPDNLSGLGGLNSLMNGLSSWNGSRDSSSSPSFEDASARRLGGSSLDVGDDRSYFDTNGLSAEEDADRANEETFASSISNLVDEASDEPIAAAPLPSAPKSRAPFAPPGFPLSQPSHQISQGLGFGAPGFSNLASLTLPLGNPGGIGNGSTSAAGASNASSGNFGGLGLLDTGFGGGGGIWRSSGGAPGLWMGSNNAESKPWGS